MMIMIILDETTDGSFFSRKKFFPLIITRYYLMITHARVQHAHMQFLDSRSHMTNNGLF